MKLFYFHNQVKVKSTSLNWRFMYYSAKSLEGFIVSGEYFEKFDHIFGSYYQKIVYIPDLTYEVNRNL